MRRPAALMSFFDLISHRSPVAGLSTNILFTWAFSDGPAALTRADVVEQLRERQQFLQPLQRKMRKVAGNVDFPYWVSDERPIDQRLRHYDESRSTWSDCLGAIANIWAHDVLDPAVDPWRIHVFYDVAEVPGCDGRATVLTFQVCHNLVTGTSVRSIARALFGQSPEPVQIVGLPPVVHGKLSKWTTARIMLSTPTRSVAEAVRWLRRDKGLDWHDTSGDLPLTPPIAINRTTSPEREIRVIRNVSNMFRSTDNSVTVVGLTAISLALERYLLRLGEPQPEDLICGVLIRTADPDAVMGINPVATGRVNLRLDTPDVRSRAAAIRVGLSRERERLDSAALRELKLRAASLPLPVYKITWAVEKLVYRAMKVVPMLSHTTLSSVFAGTEEYSLGGQSAALLSMLAFLGGQYGLTHSLMGSGDTVSMTVMAAADLPELDLYVQLLSEALADVSAALKSPSQA